MARIVLLFALVALIQVATALDCYSCDKTTCQDEMSKWAKVKDCGKTTTSPTYTGACLKQVFTDKVSNKEMTVRKCIIAEKKPDGTVTTTCNDTDGKTVNCEVCTSDFCNSARAVTFNMFALVGVAVAYLIPKFL